MEGRGFCSYCLVSQHHNFHVLNSGWAQDFVIYFFSDISLSCLMAFTTSILDHITMTTSELELGSGNLMATFWLAMFCISTMVIESLFCDNGDNARVLEVDLGFSLVWNSPEVSSSLPNDVFHPLQSFMIMWISFQTAPIIDCIVQLWWNLDLLAVHCQRLKIGLLIAATALFTLSFFPVIAIMSL